MSPETEIIPLNNNQALVRRVIEDHASLSLGTLASSDLRTLNAIEKQAWRTLYDNGITREWKTAIALVYKADVNGLRAFTFDEYAVTMDKHFSLLVKRDAVSVYDDREAGRERCVPGKWMVEMADTIKAEAERVQRVKERGEDEVILNQIMRLRG